MKNNLKRTLLALLLVFSMVLPSVSILAAGPVKMYATDGRTVQVDSNDVDAWKAVGWHEGTESIGVYAADGRTMYVFYKDLAAYKNVGWYILPPVTMYAADGRTMLVDGAEVEAYKNVGWFVSPPITMYAPDGRTVLAAGTDVAAWKAVGWYDYKIITVYNNTGNSMVIAENALSEYKSKGWHEGSETIGMYSADDRTTYAFYKDLAEFFNVGWYTEPVSGNKTEVETFVNNFFKTLQSGNMTSLSYFCQPGSGAYDEFTSIAGNMVQSIDGLKEMGLSQSDISEIMTDMYKSLFGELSYEIFNVTVNGNEATVGCRMTIPDYSSVHTDNVDMESILIKAFSDAGYPMWKLATMSEYEIMKIMPKVMKSVMKSYTTSLINAAKRNGTIVEEGTIKLKKIGGQWLVVDTN